MPAAIGMLGLRAGLGLGCTVGCETVCEVESAWPVEGREGGTSSLQCDCACGCGEREALHGSTVPQYVLRGTH